MVSDRNNLCSLAIFASGSGTNAQEIINRCQGSDWGKVVLIITDNPKAGVIKRAEKHGIPLVVLSNAERQDGKWMSGFLRRHGVSLVVLAGYLKLVPRETVLAFEKKILNIHPALLPAYGGKGMFGMNVHKAVIKNQEPFSGITIHYVNEIYDDGKIILQKKVAVESGWDANRLAAEIHKLEHAHFPVIVESLCKIFLEEKKNS